MYSTQFSRHNIEAGTAMRNKGVVLGFFVGGEGGGDWGLEGTVSGHED